MGVVNDRIFSACVIPAGSRVESLVISRTGKRPNGEGWKRRILCSTRCYGEQIQNETVAEYMVTRGQ